MGFTREQLSTLINDRNQIVIANAGSGKTTILVEKYLEIIRNIAPAEINKIVAITFTKKAAAEMKERIISQLNSEIDLIKMKQLSKEEYFREYQNLMEYREYISGAKIQTIHSFCQEILKEFAVEAGYSPNFSLMEEFLFEEIKDEMFKETLEEFLYEQNGKFEKSNLFFDSVDKVLLQSIIDLIYKNISVREYFRSNIFNKSFDEYEEKVERDLLKQLPEFFQTIINQILAVESQIIELYNNKADNLQQYLEKLRTIDFHFTLESWEDEFLSFISEINDILNYKITKRNKTVKSFIDKDIEKKIKELIEQIENLNYLDKFFEINCFIWEFYLSYELKLEEYKIENSLITYDDMLLKTNELLKIPDIAFKIQGKYSYLLIDEFQDTDDVQYSIVKSIVPKLENPKDQKNDNSTKLFIVGDPKQSIYGFRNADVRVIKKAENDILNCNSLLLESNFLTNIAVLNHRNVGEIQFELGEREKLGKIELKISHRLNLVNTAFVNFLFSQLMSESEFEYSVNYNKFIFARELNQSLDMLDKILVDSNADNDANFGSVKLLINVENSISNNNDENENHENGESVEDSDSMFEIETDNKNEAKLVANFISSLIEDKTKIYDSKLKIFREIQLKDIGILVRKRNGIDKLLNELEYLTIPFSMNDSVNFFQTQEVIDIISFLKFLYNSEDDLACASVLKSNFFGLSDNDLLQMRMDFRNSTFFECLMAYSDKTDDYKIKRAVNILQFFKDNLSRFNTYKLIDAILEKTNFAETFISSPSKNSILNNLKNLIGFVKKLNSKGIVTLYEVLSEMSKSYIDKVVEDDTNLSDENTVNLLTIHKSKGLEFPVVILYNCNSTSNRDSNFFFDDKNGLNFKFNTYDYTGKIKQVSLPGIRLSSDYNKRKEEEEEKRLLYVATTRAKDMLVISSTIKEKKNRKDGEIEYVKLNGFSKLIYSVIAYKYNDIGYIIKNKKISLMNNVTVYNKDKYNDLALDFEIPIITNIKSSQFVREFEEIKTEPKFMLVEISNTPPVLENSATKIQNLLKNPKEFVERYILQFPDILRSKKVIEIQSDYLSADLRGTVIHKLLSEISFYVDSENIINQEILSERLINEINNNNFNAGIDIISELSEEITTSLKSKFISHHIKELIFAEKEVELNMPFGNDFIKVIIDALVCMKDGTYEIWDWKSNLVQNEDKFKELSEYYEFQLKYYAFVISYLYPEQEKFVCRLFFTRLAANANKDSDWIATFEWSRADLEEFSNEIENYFERMHNPEEMYKLILENL